MSEKKSGIEKELSDLRAEIYEARNLVIKSDNLLRTLHAEVKAVAKTQERFEQRHLFSGVAAYVLFALLAAGAAFWMVQATLGPAREAAAEAETTAKEKMAAAEAALAEAREALAQQRTADRRAQEVYEALAATEPAAQSAALDRLDELDASHLAPMVAELLRERAASVRQTLVRDAWEVGRRAYLAERMGEAAEALSVVVAHDPHLPDDFEPAMRATAAYYLGAAQNRLGDHTDAARVLRAYLASPHAQRGTQAYANLLLGDSLEQSGDREAARAAFQAGLEAEPGGRHAQVLRRRIERIAAAGTETEPRPASAAPSP